MTLPVSFETDFTIKPKEQAFIEQVEDLFVKIFGIPRIGGRILGLLLLSPQPLTIEQISKNLFVSHGSVSTNLRLLILYGLIQKVTFIGERCDFYQFSSHAWDRVHQRSIEMIQELKDLASAGLDDLPPTGIVHQRIDDMAMWSNIIFVMVNESLKDWHEYLKSR